MAQDLYFSTHIRQSMFFSVGQTREQKEAELIPKMQEAVNYGLRVLESAFEHLDIKAGNSDSEDEEVTGRVEAILEPKVCFKAFHFSEYTNVTEMNLEHVFNLFVIYSYTGSLCGQTTSLSDWFPGVHGTG